VVKLRQKTLARCKQEWRKGLTPASACTDAHAPVILCAGIIVLDEVFRVERFPEPDTKAAAQSFFVVNGGCAANAAVAVARLGGRAALAGPLGGPAGEDANGDHVLPRSRAKASTVAAVRESPACPPLCQRSSSMRAAIGLS
jgi:hypothetical protein